MPIAASARHGWLGRIPLAAWAFLLYLLLAVLLFSSVWIAADRRLAFGDADIRELTWFMGWTPYALSHAQPPFFTNSIDYPSGVNLMWNTGLFMPAFLLWPVTATLGPIVASTAALTLAVASSAWAAYMVARRYVQQQAGAIGAGLVFGFSPLMISQSAGHLHMTVAVFPPLALLALDEILVRHRRWPWLVGGALGIGAVAQLLTGEEILALTVLFAAVGTAVLAAAHWRQVPARLPYVGKALVAALVIALPLAAYPLWMQFFGPERVHGTLPDAYNTDLYAPFIPTQWQLLRFASDLGTRIISRNVIELGGAYIGIPLMLICGWVTLRLWSRRIVRVASIMAVASTILAMGDTLHRDGHVTRWPLPWRLLEHLPLLQNTAPPRFMLFTYLGVALLLAVFIDWALSRPAPALRLTGIGAAAVALLALFPAVPYPSDRAVVPDFFRAGGGVGHIPAGSVVLVAPFSRHFTSDAMMWQSIAGMSFRMPEGYAYRPGPTRDPPASALQTQLNAIYYDLDRQPLTAELEQQFRDDLRRMGVGTIVVGPEPREVEVLDLFRQTLGQEPEQTGGVAVWWSISLPGA